MNGKPLPSGSKFLASCDFGLVRLEINDCLVKEGGIYKCTAANNQGIASSSGSLKVAVEGSGVATSSLHPSGNSGLQAIVNADKAAGMKLGDVEVDEAEAQRPVFTTDLPAEITLLGNQPFLLECQLEPKTDSSLRVDWYHNGLPLATGTRIKASMEFGYVSLAIADVTDRDQGVYTARAVNILGEATTFCSVTLPSADQGVEMTTLHPRGVLGLESIGQMEARGFLPDEEEPELNNQRLPQFVTQFNSAELEQGAVGHFEAKLEPTDDGNITLEWTLNGKPLAESKQIFKVRSNIKHFLSRLPLQESSCVWNGDI